MYNSACWWKAPISDVVLCIYTRSSGDKVGSLMSINILTWSDSLLFASAHLAPSVYGLQSRPKVLDYTSVNISTPCPQCLWATIGGKSVGLHKCEHQHTLPPVLMGYNLGQKCWTTQVSTSVHLWPSVHGLQLGPKVLNYTSVNISTPCPQCLWATIWAKSVGLHKCRHQHTFPPVFMGYNLGQKCWTTQVSTSAHLSPSVYGLQSGPKVFYYTSVSISTPCPQCLWATIGAKSVGLHKCQHQHTLPPVFMGYNLGHKCWTTQVSASAHLSPSVYGLQSGPKVLDYTSVNISTPFPQCLWATIGAKSVGLHKSQHQHTLPPVFMGYNWGQKCWTTQVSTSAHLAPSVYGLQLGPKMLNYTSVNISTPCPQCLWATIGAKSVGLHYTSVNISTPCPQCLWATIGAKSVGLHKCQHQHTFPPVFMGYNWGQNCWTTQVSASAHLSPSVYGLQLGPRVLDYTSVNISTPCPQCLWATIGAKSVELHKCQHQHILPPVFMEYNWGQKCWTTQVSTSAHLAPSVYELQLGPKVLDYTTQVSTLAHLAPSVYGLQLGPKVLDYTSVNISTPCPQCLWATIEAKSVGLHKFQHQHTLPPMFMGYNWGQKCWTAQVSTSAHLAPVFMEYNWGQKCWTAKMYLSVIFPCTTFSTVECNIEAGVRLEKFHFETRSSG